MFLPFLPEDNSVLDTNTDEALQILNEDIGGLLRCEADNFWRTVLDDKSLHSCLTSYLQFARSASKYHYSYGVILVTNHKFSIHVLRAELFLLDSPRLPTCRRGYDSIPNSDATFTRVHLQLAKRVFLTFLRM
jgi:hypothetical protein